MKNPENNGSDLIGKKITMWKNAKDRRFFCAGIITDYKKSKSKGHGKNTITKGLYLIDFGNAKKFWHTRSEFDLTPQPTK